MSPAETLNVVTSEGVCPILRVNSLEVSIEYYVQKLGFKVDWESPYFCSVSRGRCHISLSEGDQGHTGSWMWIGVEHAEALFSEYQGRCAKIRHPPTNYPWALEMQVEDPDGNILRLGFRREERRPHRRMDRHAWTSMDHRPGRPAKARRTSLNPEYPGAQSLP